MKKIISIFLVVVMCMTAMPAAFAVRDTTHEETLAQDLKALGIFQGVSDTEFDLGRAPTRVEALIMLIRLLGKDADAKSGKWSHPFNDVPQWANNYVGYAYENGLTNGISATEFGTGNATIQMYLTFVLRALDYSDKNGADFSYSEPYSLAYHTGILPDIVDRENFLRADVVIISYCALSAYMKNTSETLASKLIEEGVFTEAAFLQYYDKDAIEYHSAGKKELTAEEIYQKCSPAVFYIEVYDAYGDLYGSGSGFFIDSNGTAVTNYHVIEDMHTATAVLSNTEAERDILGVYDYDIENDWAIIKVAGSGYNYLTIGDQSTVIGGATVYALGSPMGLQNTISQGLISNTNRVLDGVTYIQTSAAISHGSSGGAFINKYGEVIGITSAGFVEGENLGLAIPITVIEGYDNTTLTPLNVLFASGSVQTPSSEHVNYDVVTLLREFVVANENEKINDSIAYTERVNTDNGYLEGSIVLNSDYSLEVLLWEVYNGDTYYCSLGLTGGQERFLYYNYESEDGELYFEGAKCVDVNSVTSDMHVTFDSIEGNIKKDTEEAIATEYVILGLEFVNAILEQEIGYGGYSVADLGFVNYR